MSDNVIRYVTVFLVLLVTAAAKVWIIASDYRKMRRDIHDEK